MAAGNVSETIYMAESLYLRFDIPIIMPDVMEALKAKGFDVSNINTTHVFFTVSGSVRTICVLQVGFSGLGIEHEADAVIRECSVCDLCLQCSLPRAAGLVLIGVICCLVRLSLTSWAVMSANLHTTQCSSR